MDGVLVIDKPAGLTSHDVVARVRRALGIKKAGHTGTLDPAATGVLPLVLGRATRLAQYLSGADKTYEAVIRFGCATDTHDADGAPVGPAWGGLPEAEGRERVSEIATVRAALAAFVGRCEQQPPPFSAKKVEGVRAYRMARQGRPVQPKPALVEVREIEVSGAGADTVSLTVTASAGFYVRVLAHDLGQRLGVGAHLESLRRTRSGEFGLDVAVTLDAVQDHPETARSVVRPMESLLGHLPSARLTEAGVRRAVHGAGLRAADFERPAPVGVAGPVRMLDQAGALVGLGEPSDEPGVLHPSLILR